MTVEQGRLTGVRLSGKDRYAECGTPSGEVIDDLNKREDKYATE